MLITGHKGFIGRHAMRKFGGEGLDIREGNNILTCDLPQTHTILHLAAQSKVIPSIDDPVHDATTNIIGTIRLAKRYRNSRFIFASSGGCIQETIESPYGLSKFCAEEYIKLICKDYIILRFPNIYGDKYSRSVVDNFVYGDVRIFGDGSATRDFVHVHDLLEAIQQALSWPKGVYSLGSGITHTVLELAQATGKPIEFLPAIEGELHHSVVPNNTEWRPKIDVIDYITGHGVLFKPQQWT